MKSAADLIIEHLDLWTASSLEDSLSRGRKSSSFGRVYGVDKLRSLIIHLGIKGKLAPQLSEEESATQLLAKIKLKRAAMVSGNEIKKSKTTEIASNDELDFSLPEGWIATRVGEVIDFVNGYAFSSKHFIPVGIGIVKIGDIQNGCVDLSNLSYVPQSVVASLPESLKVVRGDLLIAMSGATTGKLGFNNTDEILYLNQRVGKINPILCSKKFLFYFLTTKISENLKNSYGSAIPNLSTEQIKSIPFGMPPLSEQYRIAEKVEDYLKICDFLEEKMILSNLSRSKLAECIVLSLLEARDSDEFKNCWIRMSKFFDVLFVSEVDIERLKKCILMLAVTGRLVEQMPGEKIDQGLKDCSDGNSGYILPKGWVLTKLGEIGETSIGLTYSPNDISNDGVPVLRSTNIQNGVIDLTELVRVTTSIKPSLFLNKNDILICSRNGSKSLVGKSALIDDLNEPMVFEAFMAVLRSPYARYIKIFLDSDLFRRLLDGVETTTINQITQNNLKNTFIPLPPLEEQHRIADKVAELFLICDSLKNLICKASKQQQKLSDVLVEQALA
ncbi:restriction endonuclease subunit S [Polynucleobacter sp. JS-JIR-5-A7]|uniref:restriction endonuclease subunit S n=1 Tax=Polynucleobacter sp. JS-JIR-5-A7 TaxID=1758395 RepID=UPI001BFED46C|nr:restriction endonuclease subunit S [Polynucleobacter sp. JS-JIR-5-A7]QWE06261.1 restriction endonuclease subunit S [Polynucleobacter sp. JS-JIR-5-A7]